MVCPILYRVIDLSIMFPRMLTVTFVSCFNCLCVVLLYFVSSLCFQWGGYFSRIHQYGIYIIIFSVLPVSSCVFFFGLFFFFLFTFLFLFLYFSLLFVCKVVSVNFNVDDPSLSVCMCVCVRVCPSQAIPRKLLKSSSSHLARKLPQTC